MPTARTIVTRALKRAHVVASGTTPAGEQLAEGLDSLNDMLDAWHDEGIPTGIKGLTADQALDIDGGAIRAIIDNLAVELADDQGLEVSQLLLTRAERGRASLIARYRGTRPAKIDGALLPRRPFDIEAG